MANYVIHVNTCCLCKQPKVVYNYQCDGEHIQPTNICKECALEIAKAIDIEYDPEPEEQSCPCGKYNCGRGCEE